MFEKFGLAPALNFLFLLCEKTREFSLECKFLGTLFSSADIFCSVLAKWRKSIIDSDSGQALFLWLRSALKITSLGEPTHLGESFSRLSYLILIATWQGGGNWEVCEEFFSVFQKVAQMLWLQIASSQRGQSFSLGCICKNSVCSRVLRVSKKQNDCSLYSYLWGEKKMYSKRSSWRIFLRLAQT